MGATFQYRYFNSTYYFDTSKTEIALESCVRSVIKLIDSDKLRESI